MPWYWSDDLARALVEMDAMDPSSAGAMIAAPVAIRREEASLDEVAGAMADDDELPQAA